jgi:PAS domain S-box-containing protein
MKKLGPSNAELIMQLHDLQEENRALKASYEEARIQHLRVEEALQKSERYYRLLVNSIPDTAIHLLDQDLRYLAIGGGEVEKNNFDKAKIEGRLLHEAFPKQIADIFEPLYKKALKGDASFFEMPYGEFLYTYQVLPVKDVDGQVFATMSTAQNITKQKLAQQALEGSKRELSVLMNNLPGMVYSCLNDPDWTMKFVSEGSQGLTGYSPEEFTEDEKVSFINIIHPDDRSFIWHAIQNCLELHIPFNLEYRIITKTGIEKHVWERGQALCDPHGKIERLEGFITDITARKHAEDSLKESRLLLKSSLESQKDTILLSIDKDYRYLYFNKAHQDAMQYAYQKDIGLGMNILDCITSSEDRLIAKENYDRALHGENHSNIRVYGDVNLAYYESFFNPILNDDNEIIGATGLARNINDRIYAEQEIKSQNEELQNLNATKDKFFSIIAHDLRSPFNAFLGLTQMMVEELPSLTIAELQKMAAGMRNSATNLYQLLENLLQWAQIQKGALPFKPERVHLEVIINESIERILESAKNKRIMIDLEKMESNMVLADTNMLQSVIRNLTSNAVKYTHAGGKVTITTKKVPGGFVEISIQDTGIGMSEKMADQLFRVDSQINRKGTNGEPSTGLGLVLCSEFVEKQGGKIWAESAEGKGSTFYFTIPSIESKQIQG